MPVQYNTVCTRAESRENANGALVVRLFAGSLTLCTRGNLISPGHRGLVRPAPGKTATTVPLREGPPHPPHASQWYSCVPGFTVEIQGVGVGR